MHARNILFAISLTLAVATGALAADGELVLLDGSRFNGQVASLTEGTVNLVSDNQPRSVAAGEWMRWNHPPERKPRPRVHFGHRSSVVAKLDWTGKVPITIDADHVAIDSAVLGNLSLERHDVTCAIVEAAKEPAAAEQLLREAAIASASDRVWLVEGDLLTGRVLRFDGTTLELELGGQVLPILAKRIAAVAFANHSKPDVPTNASYLVGLDDGSLVEVADVKLRDGSFSLTVNDSNSWNSSEPGRLIFLQSLASVIVYLSDQEPVDFRHTPYFSGTWPLARDRSLTGGPLSVAGKQYAKGIAMHSAARAVYRVPAGATQFCADVAIDASAGQQGSVVFRLYRVTAEGLAPGYESQVVRGGEAPRTVRVDLAGATAVVLVVDYADRGDERDRANWLDARFVKTR